MLLNDDSVPIGWRAGISCNLIPGAPDSFTLLESVGGGETYLFRCVLKRTLLDSFLITQGLPELNIELWLKMVKLSFINLKVDSNKI